MIHDVLRNQLATALPDVTWTVNHYLKNDDTGTVIANGGDGAGRFESPVDRPTYQVMIRSSDWDKAELYAYEALKLLNKTFNETYTTYLYKNQKRVKRLTVKLFYLENYGGVLNLGINDDNVQAYSINFDATLQVLNEEEL